MASATREIVLLIAGLAAMGALRFAHAQDVTIYRCIDNKGHLTLRDTPCEKDQKQEARTMARPQDAPRKHAEPATSQPPPQQHEYEQPQVASRDTYLAPPRPMYECITPDGVSYTSDTGDGNPRWVPLWTVGYPAFNRVGSGMIGPSWSGPSNYNGTYVRDTCYMLPPADVCARTRDRRDEVRTRFFNAMPSERDVLRVEERSLNARLDNDCGGQ
ncbi:DUF4124 domain-containing protein [Lysobacter sp. 2RAF19]